MPRMTREQRTEIRERCFALSLDGYHAPSIARDLGIHEVTVKRLLAEARQLRRAERDAAGEHADLVAFLAEQDQVMAEASHWLEQLRGDGKMKDLGLNVSGLLNTKSTASRRKAEAVGLFVHRTALTNAKGQDLNIVEIVRAALAGGEGTGEDAPTG